MPLIPCPTQSHGSGICLTKRPKKGVKSALRGKGGHAVLRDGGTSDAQDASEAENYRRASKNREADISPRGGKTPVRHIRHGYRSSKMSVPAVFADKGGSEGSPLS